MILLVIFIVVIILLPITLCFLILFNLIFIQYEVFMLMSNNHRSLIHIFLLETHIRNKLVKRAFIEDLSLNIVGFWVFKTAIFILILITWFFQWILMLRKLWPVWSLLLNWVLVICVTHWLKLIYWIFI